MTDQQLATLSPEQLQQLAKQVAHVAPTSAQVAPIAAPQQPAQAAQPAQTEMPNMSLAQTRMTMAEKVEWCKLMSQGTMVPKQYQGSPSNVLFALEYAEAVGVPAIHALTSVSVVNGKPSPMADLMITLTRKAGHTTWTEVSEDGESATTYIIRKDMPERTFSETFDRKLAEKAGLWGKQGPWSQYPDVMLANRSKSRAVRMHCNEVLAGVDTSAEEQADMEDQADDEQQDTKQLEEKKPKGIAAAKARGRKRATTAKKAEEKPAEEAPVDPDNLSPAAVAMLNDAREGDGDTRRELWRQAKGLSEPECAYVRAEIEAMSEETN